MPGAELARRRHALRSPPDEIVERARNGGVILASTVLGTRRPIGEDE